MAQESNKKEQAIDVYNVLTPVIYEAIMNDEQIKKLTKGLSRLYSTAIPIGSKHHDGQSIIKYSEEVNKADAQIKELLEERKNEIINAYRYLLPNGR